jgi:Pyridoxamine 5'-phosphate oxidase
MTAPSREPHEVMPRGLSDAEVDEILEARLIANLTSINPNGTVHLVAMWFRRDGDSILFPTSHHTRKAKNLRRHPFATVMIDRSRDGLDLRGVQIKGGVELIDGPRALELNRSIHERYLTAEALARPAVAAYLSGGDDVTIRLSIERTSTWNLADGPAGQALRGSGLTLPLDV